MQKIYKKKILFPNYVKLKRKKQCLVFHGLLGSTLLNLKKLDILGIAKFQIFNSIELENNKKIQKQNLIFYSNCKRFFYSIINLIQNKINGVSSGFLVYIKIIGVGYRVEIIKNEIENLTLKFKIGFSHDFKYIVPKSIRAFLVEPTLICLYGIDKNQVTQIAAKIRNIKTPSVYKGKGIRLVNESVFIKPGKKK